MPKTITKISLPGPQIFNMTVHGFNVNTILNVYFEGKKVGAYDQYNLGRSWVAKYGDPFSPPMTDSNGTAMICLALGSDYSSLVGYSESSVAEALALDSTSKKVVIVDKASVDSATLPADYASQARCFASTLVYKTVTEATKTETKNWDFTDPVKDALAGGSLSFETF